MPTFRTPEDDENQRQIAGVLEARWNCVLHRRDDWDAVNYDAIRNGGDPVALVEVKRRDNDAYDYDGRTFLGVHRHNVMMAHQRRSGLPAVWAVGFNDQIRWILSTTVEAADYERDWRGREPREGALHDKEPMILVPVADMIKIPWSGVPH